MPNEGLKKAAGGLRGNAGEEKLRKKDTPRGNVSVTSARGDKSAREGEGLQHRQGQVQDAQEASKHAGTVKQGSVSGHAHSEEHKNAAHKSEQPKKDRRAIHDGNHGTTRRPQDHKSGAAEEGGHVAASSTTGGDVAPAHGGDDDKPTSQVRNVKVCICASFSFMVWMRAETMVSKGLCALERAVTWRGARTCAFVFKMESGHSEMDYVACKTHAHTHMHMYMHIHVHTNVYTRAHKCKHANKHTYMHLYTHIDVHTYAHAHMHTRMDMHAHAYACILTYTRLYSQACPCMRSSQHECIQTFANLHARTHARTHMCQYTGRRTHTCMN
jgi:hypothetical protein